MSMKPRPGILDIIPYKGGKAGSNHRDPVRLASNENPFGPSPMAGRAYMDIVSDLHRYPDGHSYDLRQAIAAHHALSEDKILCGAGSDELISFIIQAYAGPGAEVLYSDHSFAMYRLSALAHGAHPVCAPDVDLGADPDSLLSCVTSRTKVVFLANPNNPTGRWLGYEALSAFAARLPNDVLLVLDAAYAEYAEHAPDYESGLKLVEAHDNVCMIRTFSKIYGLAAVRLGWMYASTDVIDVMNSVRGPFNVSMQAQAAGIAALMDSDYRDKSIRHNSAMLEKATTYFESIGLFVTPSLANFLLVEVPESFGMSALHVLEALEQQGIMVRGMAGYGLPDHLRISMGTEQDMSRLFEALERLSARQ